MCGRARPRVHAHARQARGDVDHHFLLLQHGVHLLHWDALGAHWDGCPDMRVGLCVVAITAVAFPVLLAVAFAVLLAVAFAIAVVADGLACGWPVQCR